MKHYKLLLLIFLLSLGNTSCEKNEIELYNETPRLNFHQVGYSVSFNDADYVQGLLQKEWQIRINMQGRPLSEAQTFCLAIRSNEEYTLKAEVSFDEKYLFASDSIFQMVTIQIKRPEQITTTAPYRADICFDLENPLHQFDAGREDLEIFPLEVHYKIKPINWDEWYWGKYSDAKYFFMMNHFKATLNDIPQDYSAQEEIFNAYETYKQTNPPLLDENGEEIVFKQ